MIGIYFYDSAYKQFWITANVVAVDSTACKNLFIGLTGKWCITRIHVNYKLTKTTRNETSY